jgi:hypothetical protein
LSRTKLPCRGIQRIIIYISKPTADENDATGQDVRITNGILTNLVCVVVVSSEIYSPQIVPDGQDMITNHYRMNNRTI